MAGQEKTVIATCNVDNGCSLRTHSSRLEEYIKKMKTNNVHLLGIGQTHWMGEGVFRVIWPKAGSEAEAGSKSSTTESDDYMVFHCADSDTAWRGVAIVVTNELRDCITSWDMVSSRIVSVDFNLKINKQEDASPKLEDQKLSTSSVSKDKKSDILVDKEPAQPKVTPAEPSYSHTASCITIIQVFSPRSPNVLGQHTEFWDQLKSHVESKLQGTDGDKRLIVIMGDILKYEFKIDEKGEYKKVSEKKFTVNELEEFIKLRVPAGVNVNVWVVNKNSNNFMIRINKSEQLETSFARTGNNLSTEEERSLIAEIPFQFAAGTSPFKEAFAFEYNTGRKVEWPPSTIDDNQPSALHSSVYDGKCKFLTNSTEFLGHVRELCKEKYKSENDFVFVGAETPKGIQTVWFSCEKKLLTALPLYYNLRTLDMTERRALSQIRCLITRVISLELRFPKQCSTIEDLQLDFPPSASQMSDMLSLIQRFALKKCNCTCNCKTCGCELFTQCDCHCKKKEAEKKKGGNRKCTCKCTCFRLLKRADEVLKTMNWNIKVTITKIDWERLLAEIENQDNSRFHVEVLQKVLAAGREKNFSVAVQWGGVILGTLTSIYPKPRVNEDGGSMFLLLLLLQERHLGENWKNCGAKINRDNGMEVFFFGNTKKGMQDLEPELTTIKKDFQQAGISITLKEISKFTP